MKRKYLLIGIIVLVSVSGFLFFSGKLNIMTVEVVAEDNIMEVYNSLSLQAKALYLKQSEGLTKPVPKRIVELDELNIGCFGPTQVLQMSTSDTNLGGQCCGVLKDIEGYEIQLEAIEKFIEEHGNIDLIPKDPYDLSVEHAQLLTSFDRDITLTSAQQVIYDEAMENSHHGGPCCCKCWKWYVMSGLAKRLIVDYDFNAEDVSELWDISSSCGHAEDTNFNEHYSEKEEHHNQ